MLAVCDWKGGAGMPTPPGLEMPAGGGIDVAVSRLVDQALEVWSRPGFDTLLSLGHVNIEPFEHQVSTVLAVLRRMRGRAMRSSCRSRRARSHTPRTPMTRRRPP